ncbi:Putative RNA-directed DNA polymerase [Arachis hypogaea]|nr:Putative RNA-directed DNA polymerase [Arachis hypogaea]
MITALSEREHNASLLLVARLASPRLASAAPSPFPKLTALLGGASEINPLLWGCLWCKHSYACRGREPAGRTKSEPGRFTEKRKLLIRPFSLSFFHSERDHANPAKKLHHRRKEWHTAAVRRTQSSPSVRLSSFPRAPSLQPLFVVTDAAASSSSASVVFVCSAALSSPFVCRSSSRLRSAVVFVRVLRGSRSLGVHRSRSLAAHRSSSHSRSSGSHAALLQTLRPTRALHLAVELLSFVAAVSSLNPPPDNTLTQHQYSASNSATSDFYYNK